MARFMIDTQLLDGHGQRDGTTSAFDSPCLMNPIRFLSRTVRPRSNGVAVRRDVARLIRLGNAARSSGNWLDAATAYADALQQAPALAHIWVQLGHARKEAGDLETARIAYARAATLAPSDADPHIHLGLSAKLLGRPAQANGHYLAALERVPDNLSVSIDALLTAPPEGADRERVMAKIASLVGIERFGLAAETGTAVSCAICADITDLLAYFGNARLPTGIQRVQIEILMAIGTTRPGLATICCYSAQRQGWSEVAVDRFLALARMALTSDDRDDPTWRREVAAMHVALALAHSLRFATGAVLLNLGTSWSERNYFLHIRTEREMSGLAYIPMVYDCIPMFAPQWFPTALARDYGAWMNGLFDAADGMIAISEATRQDLLEVAADQEVDMARNAIRVVAMDGDFRRIDQTSVGIDRLASWALQPESYVLMVSTIEPRKNHVGAFEAWLALAARHGAKAVPKLVCVGGRGWLNDPVHAMLRRHRLLRHKVVLLSGIADADLDLLYRCARFTLYPSLYEGWGLPVTESLCHGRVPAISRTSSLPEAGGAFAVYFDPNDPASIADAVEPLIFDTVFRSSAEQRIREEFRPRPWHRIGEDVAEQAMALAKRHTPAAIAPHARPNIFYAMGAGRTQEGNLLSGERFRAGRNWLQPSAQGNPIGQTRVTLRMKIPDGNWSAQLLVSSEASTLCEIASGDCEWQHAIDTSSSPAWIELILSPDAEGVAEFRIGADDRPLLLIGLAVTRPGSPPPTISGAAPA